MLHEDLTWAVNAPCTRAVADGLDPWGSSDYRDRHAATATCVKSSCLLPCAKYAEGQRWTGVVIAGWAAPEANQGAGARYPGLDAVLAHYVKSHARQTRRARRNHGHTVSATPDESVKVAV